MFEIRLQVHSTGRDEAGARMAGPTHAVVRCKVNQIISNSTRINVGIHACHVHGTCGLTSSLTYV
jgi:hypothetical protein